MQRNHHRSGYGVVVSHQLFEHKTRAYQPFKDDKDLSQNGGPEHPISPVLFPSPEDDDEPENTAHSRCHTVRELDNGFGRRLEWNDLAMTCRPMVAAARARMCKPNTC